MVSDTETPRRMWDAVERFHAGPVYLEPECRAEAAAAGCRGFWMGYFATRAAPMGAVGAATVESIFFYFSPGRVRRAIPDAWTYTTPAAVLAARRRGVDAALRRLLGDDAGGPELAEAAELARRAAVAGTTLGRPLYAAWADLDWPDAPHEVLWHAATLLREHRSGAHLWALAAHELDGCEAVVLHAAADGAPLAWIEGEAGWSPEEAAAARQRLAVRGWLDGRGRATERGLAVRADIEALTDAHDLAPWRALGATACDRLAKLLGGLNRHFPPDDQLDWQHHYGPNQHGASPEPDEPGPADVGATVSTGR